MGGFRLKLIYKNDSLNWSFQTTDFSLSDIENSVNDLLIGGVTDYDTCVQALAAIDTLARMKSNSDMKSACNAPADSFVPIQTRQPSKELIKKALKALKDLVDESSILSDIWGIEDKHETWKNGVKALELMLKK